jgi:hypothetical protein
MEFSENGVIGKSGRFYPCAINGHIKAQVKNRSDSPFVIVRGNSRVVSFEAFYTADRTIPTQEQFETLMDWCTEQGESFEEVTDCWSAPWESYRA